jgi:hypothetical protein
MWSILVEVQIWGLGEESRCSSYMYKLLISSSLPTISVRSMIDCHITFIVGMCADTMFCDLIYVQEFQVDPIFFGCSFPYIVSTEAGFSMGPLCMLIQVHQI